MLERTGPTSLIIRRQLISLKLSLLGSLARLLTFFRTFQKRSWSLVSMTSLTLESNHILDTSRAILFILTGTRQRWSHLGFHPCAIFFSLGIALQRLELVLCRHCLHPQLPLSLFEFPVCPLSPESFFYTSALSLKLWRCPWCLLSPSLS